MARMRITNTSHHFRLSPYLSPQEWGRAIWQVWQQPLPLADLVLSAMFNYFGYCNKARLLRREDFSNTSWALMIDEELCNHRPVLYFGSSSGGSAHAFIIDGCDGKGMYHINWGAGGKSNGYFRLNTLRPSVLNENHSAFDNSQTAIFGLSPHYTKTAASTHLATHKFTANTTTAILEGRMLNLDISHDFSCLVNIAYVDEAIGLYKDGKLISFQAIDKQVYALRYRTTNVYVYILREDIVRRKDGDSTSFYTNSVCVCVCVSR